jgi:2-dehydropantoate 2-reductase
MNIGQRKIIIMSKKNNSIKRIAILGTGGVGGVVAAVLASEGLDITCVVREPNATIMRNQGLSINSVKYGELQVYPKIVQKLVNSVDLLFIATKATQLDEALLSVDPASVSNGFVLPLLNGIEHMSIIRRQLGGKVLAGSIRVESKTIAPCKILHASKFLIITIASDNILLQSYLNDIAHFLNIYGLETRVAKNESYVLWEKLVRLAALACTTTLTNQPLGFILNDIHWKKILRDAVQEGVMIANSLGISMNFEVQWDVVKSLPDSLTTSMQRDIWTGRPSEFDAIVGALIRVAHRQNIPCPVYEHLADQIERGFKNE